MSQVPTNLIAQRITDLLGLEEDGTPCQVQDQLDTVQGQGKVGSPILPDQV